MKVHCAYLQVFTLNNFCVVLILFCVNITKKSSNVNKIMSHVATTKFETCTTIKKYYSKNTRHYFITSIIFSIFQIHAIISVKKFAEQFPQKVQKIVQNLDDRQKRNSHEKSHQSATVRDEVNEAKTLRSLLNVKLIFLEIDQDLVYGEAENRLS
jgi:hypothetical protein